MLTCCYDAHLSRPGSVQVPREAHLDRDASSPLTSARDTRVGPLEGNCCPAWNSRLLMGLLSLNPRIWNIFLFTGEVISSCDQKVRPVSGSSAPPKFGF